MKRAMVMLLLVSATGVATAYAEQPTSPDASASSADTPPEEAQASASEVTLRWKARQEERAYGYIVYRAERREGPYRRVSDRIIRIDSGGGEAASAYTWTDRDVVAGATYFYYLDIVSIGGIKQRFSGVLSRVAPEPAPNDTEAP